MKIKTDEITSVIKQEIEQFSSELEISQVGRVVEIGDGIARIAAYVVRQYPIDRARVIVAGEGTGATVVAATSLYAGDLDFEKLSVVPRQAFYRKRIQQLVRVHQASGRRRLDLLLRGHQPQSAGRLG